MGYIPNGHLTEAIAEVIHPFSLQHENTGGQLEINTSSLPHKLPFHLQVPALSPGCQMLLVLGGEIN